MIVYFNFFPDFTIRPEDQIEKDRSTTAYIADAKEQPFSNNYTATTKVVDDFGGAELLLNSATNDQECYLTVAIPRNSKNYRPYYTKNLQAQISVR